MSRLLIRDVEVDGARADVHIADGVVRAVVPHDPGSRLSEAAPALAGGGGALLPGLWDHHIHLVALAAAERSVPVGPPEVSDRSGLAAALGGPSAQPDGWIRAVGYHESVAGLLDRSDLDELAPGVPIRVQHRSGALWILSSEALRRLHLDDPAGPSRDRLELDARGRPTGRLYGQDRWLRERIEAIAPQAPPDLGATGQRLAALGVVGVTDATPYERAADLELLADAARTGALPQHVVATGAPALAGEPSPVGLARGPVKLRLADHALPSLDEVAGWIAAAHQADRAVAVHCVTREALVLTLAALDEAGHRPGDRIEHGAVVPPELGSALRRHRLTVVTQPGFVAERGDRYRAEVEPDDLPHLYPCASLLDDGVAVAGSTDAPFGDPDPWRAMVAAVGRRTPDGTVLGAREAVAPGRALQLFLGRPEDPGGPPRRVAPGEPADLVLLGAPLAQVLAAPSADAVRATVVRGSVVHER